jgi:hypothetical protein
MPTDVDRAFARKRAAQAKVQTEINMLLFGLISALACCLNSWAVVRECGMRRQASEETGRRGGSVL